MVKASESFHSRKRRRLRDNLIMQLLVRTRVLHQQPRSTVITKAACVVGLAVLLLATVTAQTSGSYEKVHSKLRAKEVANARGYATVGFSPEIMSIPHKPFTATRTYNDQHTKNGENAGDPITAECTIARDDKGRIHYEMAFEREEKGLPVIGFDIQIYDPVAQTLTRYFAKADHSLPSEPQAEVRKLDLMSDLMKQSLASAPKDEGEEMVPALAAAEETKAVPPAAQSAVTIVPTKDNLPVQRLDGIPVAIDRTIVKYGDKQQFLMIQDNWFSPDWAIDIRMTVLRENFGKQTFETKNIVSGEPDPALFEIPPGYVIDLFRQQMER